MSQFKRAMEVLRRAERLREWMDEKASVEADGFGDDPCQQIRDALVVEQDANALLVTAVAISDAAIMELQMELMECENPTP